MAEIIVEDGGLVPGANSFATLDQADAYHSDMGNLSWQEASETIRIQALIRAGRYLNSLAWKGVCKSQDQDMSWPRTGVADRDGRAVAEGKVPKSVVMAQCEAAAREVESPGALEPDLERGGLVAASKVDCLETTWLDSAPAGTVFTAVKGLLAGYLRTPGSTELKRW